MDRAGTRLEVAEHPRRDEVGLFSLYAYNASLLSDRYIGTSLTPAEPIPLPEPYTDVFPETEEEWDDLRQKTAVVEKVRGWVKSVENSVVEEEPARKRKRQSASASPARKKRKEEKGAAVCGYDPKDPSPLGFVVAKKVPVQAKRGAPKVLVPDSSPARPPSSSSPPPPHKDASSPEDAEMESPPPPRASISSVPEDAFFPPSFPSDLVTSTPKPVEVGNESSNEDAPPVKTADLRSKPLSTAKATPSSSKPPVPTFASKPLSSANLARHRDSKLYLDIDLASPTKSLSSIAGDDDDYEDDEVLLGAAGLADEEAEHGMQFDWQSEADDLEGFLERDVSMYGDQDEEESPSHRVEYHREAEERDGQEQDEDTMFGKWFNLPRKSASTSASGAGGWFGRR